MTNCQGCGVTRGKYSSFSRAGNSAPPKSCSRTTRRCAIACRGGNPGPQTIRLPRGPGAPPASYRVSRASSCLGRVRTRRATCSYSQVRQLAAACETKQACRVRTARCYGMACTSHRQLADRKLLHVHVIGYLLLAASSYAHASC